MIVKFFEIEKKNLKNYNFFLLYGNNEGLIKETLEKKIKPLFTKNIFKYEEIEIIKNPENFSENIYNKSFFENEKLIIISRTSDKIYKIIENIFLRKIENITFILLSGVLDKRSKLRGLFEKKNNLICIPFYEDNNQSLKTLAQNFFREKKILISQQNINLIIERCRGDRMNLYNELQKIGNFSQVKKKLETEDIVKLTNLSENFSFAELIDNTLVGNLKKTLYILNENNFTPEDSISILRIFISKLKRLVKIKSQINNINDTEKVMANYKPPIFWKEKDIIRRQISYWDLIKIQNMIGEINNLEILAKKYPSVSLNIVTDYILKKVNISKS